MTPTATWRAAPWPVWSVVILMVGGSVLAGCSSGGSSSITPPSTKNGRPVARLTPTPSLSRPYRDGETITISVPANSYFSPNVRVEVLECADKGGLATNLPTSDIVCDGNTVPDQTIYVQTNGSVSASYPVYSLPNTLFEEAPDDIPKCDKSNPCVLYIGLDQTNFSMPHIFSAPFTMQPGPDSTPASIK